jgi:NADH-quinone oxidoreductase subunit C
VKAERARELLASVVGVTVGDGPAAASAEAGRHAPVVAHVTTGHWEDAARFAKDTLGCTFFAFATVIDWKTEGLEVVAWVDNLDAGLSVQLRTKLGPGNTTCPSLVAVYRGANWMEREAYDMFGVRFDDHPDLRRILLADDWDGHPLLKSYAVDTPHPPYR